MIWILLLFQALTFDVWAARSGRIDVDGVDLYNGPGEGYEVIDQLPQGAPITASNFPTEGYYKIRTSTGRVGWVEADSIKFDSPLAPGSIGGSVSAGGAGQEQAPLSSDPSNPFRGGSPAYRQEPSSSRRAVSFVRARAFFGGTFFNAESVNRQLNFTELKTGMNFGGELGFRFTKDFAVMFRAENLFRNQAAHNPSANKFYNLDYYTFPVMAGVEITLSEEKNFSSSFAIYGGLGVNTSLDSQALGQGTDSTNVTSFRNTPFAGLGKLNFSYHFNKDAHATLEVGYRFLRTPNLLPTIDGVGSEIWQAGSVFQEINLDFSGVLLGGAITLQF